MKKRVLIVGGILIAVGIAGGVGWRYYDENIRITSNEDIAYVTKVSVITDTSTGVVNRFAGVVEPQQTVEVNLESGRTIKELAVETGDVVKKGQLLFEYDLSSIEEDIQETQLELDRLKNEALSLTEQISTLEKEKKKASSDNQLSYTIEIETNKMNLKKNEYDQKSKTAELERLQNATGNTEVRSEIEGIIQKIDTSKMTTEDGDSVESGSDYYSYDSYDSSESNAFITILSTGAYQIKGSINEQNMQSLYEGDSVLVFSRVDETQTWKGVVSTIDRENSSSTSSSDMYYYGMSSTNSMTSSSSYPFYIELEDSDGLMLGQHVYIEPDNGQAEAKTGLWLSEFYIADLYEDNPFVWAADENGRLEKREVTLGDYDANLMEYEILDGLSTSDSIAYPDDNLEEGMKTADSSTQPDVYDDGYDSEMIDMEDEFYDDSYEVIDEWDDEEFYDETMEEDIEFMDEDYYEEEFDEEFIDEEYMDDEVYMEEFFEDEVEVLE